MGIFTAHPPLQAVVPPRTGTPPSPASSTPHPRSPSLPQSQPQSQPQSPMRLYLHSHLPRLRSHPNLRSSSSGGGGGSSTSLPPAPPPPPVLTSADIVELRALQRTFEGAYMRTALSQFSFALLVLKIFTHEFYSIGALYAAFGVCVFAVSILRRKEGNKQFFVVVHEEKLLDPLPPPPLVSPVAVAVVAGDQSQWRRRDADNREGDVRDSVGARVVETETGTAAASGVRVKVNAERWFRTSGNVVFAVTGVSVVSYVALLVLILQLGK